MTIIKIKHIAVCLTIAALTGCASNIQPVGELGPNKLRVFVIKNSDFLSASRMLVILDKKGNVTAYSGSTVAGAGTVTMQAADTVVSAGAIVMGARAIESGLKNAHVTGIPKSVNIKTDNTIRTNSAINITGAIKK